MNFAFKLYMREFVQADPVSPSKCEYGRLNDCGLCACIQYQSLEPEGTGCGCRVTPHCRQISKLCVAVLSALCSLPNGAHGYGSPAPCYPALLRLICIRFAVAPCSFSFLRMCGSEKNRLDLDVSKQYTLFVLRRDCWILTGSGAYIV